VIRTMYRSGKGGFTTDVPVSHWRVALRDAEGLLWVDVHNEPADKIDPFLREIFNFHPLAIDDALRETHVPKIDNWGDYAYAVLHGITYDDVEIKLGVQELDVFLGRNYLVTHHRQPLEIVNRVWQSACSDQRRLERGADFLLYDLLDLLSAEYMPVIDSIDDTIDRIEGEVFERPTRTTLNTIFAIKRVALQMRRIIGPQREVLNRLARDDYAMIDAKDRVYYRDVYDHLVRLADINESLRDLISGSLDTYLSVTSNRTNEIMKVLTIISALFMPLAFLTGFFGMNFTNIPFDSPALLAGALIVMVCTPLAMYVLFKRRGWM
jgi:magnesium transporter